MKVIDLLNKIANGEEVPKINYDKHILKYNKDEKRFIDENGLNSLYEIDFSELNDEVEIIEEETTVSEEQVLFNNLTTIDQEYVIRIMKMLQQPIDYLKSKGDE